MADKNKTEKKIVGFASEMVNYEPYDSSSDSSNSKVEDSAMDWNPSAVMVWQPQPSCLRQSLSMMASSARTRIGSFQAITGLGHGGFMAPSLLQPLKKSSSMRYCDHSQAELHASEEQNDNTSKKRKVGQFSDKPTCHTRKRIKTKGSSHKGIKDQSACTLGSTLRNPSDDVSMDDSSDEAMDFSNHGNDDAMAMYGQKRSHNDTDEDVEIESVDSPPKRMAVD